MNHYDETPRKHYPGYVSPEEAEAAREAAWLEAEPCASGDEQGKRLWFLLGWAACSKHQCDALREALDSDSSFLRGGS